MSIEKLYTVDDVAMMTGLSSRTIRNYLKEGSLNGKKVGVQWRFTERDIESLFKDRDFKKEVSDNKVKLVTDFLDKKDKEMKTICSVIDYPANNVEIVEKVCNQMMDIVNSYEGKTGLNFSYEYFNESNMARFIIIGELEQVTKLINIIR